MAVKCEKGTVFYKRNKDDTIWWRDADMPIGPAFSFDKETIYLFPYGYSELTAEQKELFNKENPRKAKYLQEHGIE